MEKKLFLSIGFLLMICNLMAQDCDCNIWPFKPDECFDKCVVEIIQKASVNELMLIVGFSGDLAEKVKSLHNYDNINSINDYRSLLKEDEFNNLKDKLSNLSVYQNKYFMLEEKEKTKFNKQLNKLNAKTDIQDFQNIKDVKKIDNISDEHNIVE